MSSRRAKFSRLVLALFLMLQAGTATVGEAAWQETVELDAVEVWEKAIEAKGGRERLHAIEKFLVSYRPMRWGKQRWERLYAFPDRYWTWSDDRPGRFGLYASAYNHSTGITWYQMGRKHKPRMSDDTKGRHYIFHDSVVLLMETKWLKPKPLTVRRGKLVAKLGSRKVYIVRTSLEDWEIDFYLDEKTYLVRMIAEYWVDPPDGNPVDGPLHVTANGDYREVDGIMMPGWTGSGTTKKMKVRFQFNVDHDPGLFDRAPNIDDGPEAWKRKPQPN